MPRLYSEIEAQPLTEIAELGGQVRQIGRFGSEAQCSAAAQVLTEATRKLYAILAAEPERADGAVDESPADDGADA